MSALGLGISIVKQTSRSASLLAGEDFMWELEWAGNVMPLASGSGIDNKTWDLDGTDYTPAAVGDVEAEGYFDLDGSSYIQPLTQDINDAYSTVLDGTNDHVTAHGAASEVDGNAGSVSVWFKLETVPYTKWLFEILVNSNNLVQVYYHGSTNQTRFEHVGGSSSNEIVATTAVEGNGWHHLVMTWDTSANALIGYIDGSSVATGNAAAFTGTLSSILMGYSAWGNAWEGNINDFAIFDDVLTAGEVTAIYNSGAPTDLSSHSGLVGYWKFEENTGTSVADSSSNSNVATLVNGAAFESDTP